MPEFEPPSASYSKEEPLNREPPVKDLLSSFLTKTAQKPYDRNHGPIPHLDASIHIIEINGLVSKQLCLTRSDLQALPRAEVTCALQCAGNRRHTMRTQLKEVQGIDWGDGAVMNCSWRGVRLMDVLRLAGVDEDGLDEERIRSGQGKMNGSQSTPGDGIRHVTFGCYQVKVQEDDWYGGSIELWRAMDPKRDVLLAIEMNNEPLTDEHGAPIRVIVPGVAGARSVKWLDRITVQQEESSNFYQKHDYKILPPAATDRESAEKFWDEIPALMDMPINSVIGVPEEGSEVEIDKNGLVEVRGYALPHGADGPVLKVEVSGDGGESWVEAQLNTEVNDRGKWSWVLWQTMVKLEVGGGRGVLSRATDKNGNVQKANPEWNLRGVAYNGYGSVKALNVIERQS